MAPSPSLPLTQDPIIAIATAPGRGAVGIVRASGQGLLDWSEALTARQLAPRGATLLTLRDADGAPIDQCVALYFPAPHSYTGEDVLELQCHGGPVGLQLLLTRCFEVAVENSTVAAQGRAVPRLPNLRLAQPGEFTQRAFLNGKLDLAQAEAVADLIEAGTEAAARSAAQSLHGAFSREIEALATQTVALRTLVEATLDFPEEDIEFLERAGARARLGDIQRNLAAVLARTRQGALLREGTTVVLAGQPNVGKSSLLNALAGAELAIVTPIAGTTRDKVAQTVQIEGVPVHIVDTAGLRELGALQGAAESVERIGIERSWAAIDHADSIVFLHDLTRGKEPGYIEAEQVIAGRLARVAPERLLHVYNKSDAIAPDDLPAHALCLSALTGAGLAALRRSLVERAGWQSGSEGQFIARTRHVQALQRCAAHLAEAQEHAARGNTELELLAEALRSAHEALGEITGAFNTDDLLGEIFGRFCIGK